MKIKVGKSGVDSIISGVDDTTEEFREHGRKIVSNIGAKITRAKKKYHVDVE